MVILAIFLQKIFYDDIYIETYYENGQLKYKSLKNNKLNDLIKTYYENGEKKLWSSSIDATNIEFLGNDLYKVEFNIKPSIYKNEYKSYYTILNRDGNKIHSGYFEKVEESFKDGYIVKTRDKGWGILDRDGQIKELSKINQYNIEEPWDDLESIPLPIFENGIVRINEDEKIGAINLNGDLIVKPEYSYIEISKDFIVATKLEEVETEVEGQKAWNTISKKELFDLNGTKILPGQYSKIEPLDKNTLIIGKDSKEYLISLKENKIISEKYDGIQKTIVNNLLEAHLDGKVGYINNLGKVKIDLKYDRALVTMEYADYPYSSYAFNEEHIFLERDQKVYLVNSSGKEISEIGKSDDFDFYNGFGIFKYGIAQVLTASGEYGYINTKGETIALYDSPEKLEKDPIVQEIMFKGAKKETDFREDLIREMKNDKFGYVDSSGNYIIPPKFDWGSEFRDNQAIVMIDSDYKILKKDGTFLLLEK
ncbi:WG repeat-containing protein (plasmid) [Cetobacterium somerae]|uniref:WG repeat-containing protein n=1 Tax=Cetobacterium somerae TaxID=188913 RepID=UPI003D7670CF